MAEYEGERESGWGSRNRRHRPLSLIQASPSPLQLTSPPLVIGTTCPLHHVHCRPDSHKEKDQTVAMEIVCSPLLYTSNFLPQRPSNPFQISTAPPSHLHQPPALILKHLPPSDEELGLENELFKKQKIENAKNSSREEVGKWSQRGITQNILLRVGASLFHEYQSDMFQSSCIIDTEEGTLLVSPGCSKRYWSIKRNCEKHLQVRFSHMFYSPFSNILLLLSTKAFYDHAITSFTPTGHFTARPGRHKLTFIFNCDLFSNN